jgi:hypothetical protein
MPIFILAPAFKEAEQGIELILRMFFQMTINNDEL